MKINRKTALIALAGVIAVICIGIIISASKDPASDEGSTDTLPDAVSAYADAVDAINALPSFNVSSEYSKSFVVDDEVLSLSASKSFMLYGHGTEKMSALGDEKLTIGSHSVEFETGYANGTAYISADGKQFHAPMSQNDFLTQQASAVFLDESLYKSITIEKSNAGFILTFSNALAGEHWALPENAQLISAAGTAILDESMRLTESTYSLSYSIDSIPTRVTLKSSIDYAAKAFTVPVRADSVIVDSLESVRLLEIACGHLVQSNTVLSKITENIMCQAFGDSREQFTRINMNAAGTNCIANIRINTTLSNFGKADAATQKSQWIQYKNGQYLLSVDGGNPTQETGITPYMMKTYCQDYYLSTLIQSKYITSATVSNNEDTYRYEYTANDAFAHQLCQSASQILYQDPALLFTVSENFTIESAKAFLEIDKYTALPISSGISCNVSHTVGGFSYQLQYSIQQTYDVPSAAAARLK